MLHVEWTTNYNNTFVPTVIEIQDEYWDTIRFQSPSSKSSVRWFEHQLQDLPTLEWIQTYKFTSEDGDHPSLDRISFYYIIHPGIGAIIIPPNSIEMTHHKHQKWISQKMQRFFELLAHKHWYRLIVGITSETMWDTRSRVKDILLGSGYYISDAPSPKNHIHYGIHQSTLTQDGIPDLWIKWEWLIPPKIN